MMSFFVFVDPVLFSLAFFSFSVFSLNWMCWGSFFFFFDSKLFVSFVYMSVFVGFIVYFMESDYVIFFVTSFLVWVSFLFFFSVNLLMVYLFFELSLFPIVFMLLGYGLQVERLSASYYLLFYAIFFSFPFMYCVFKFFDWFFSYFVFCGWEYSWLVSLAFLVKFPVYFLHLWLPKAHVEAPTYASILLAGLLLKLGGVGLLRVLPSLVDYFYFFLFVGLFGSVLAAFICSFQSDLKSLVAFSSISHMSFVLVGLVIFCCFSKFGSVLLMLAHGFSSSAMFFLVGSSFHYLNSRKVYFLNSVMSSSLFISALYVFVIVSNFSAPPMVPFVSESSLFSSLFHFYPFVSVVLCFYLMYVLYFSLYFLVNSLVGKMNVFFFDFLYGHMFFFVLAVFNLVYVFSVF